jgi:hypothetical protein
LVDNLGQPLIPRVAHQSSKALFESNKNVSIACSNVEIQSEQNDIVTHQRVVIMISNEANLIVDHVITEHAHKFAFPWHFHPECVVKPDGNSGLYIKNAGLDWISVSSVRLKRDLVRGQIKPFIQGWYSPEYNERVPSTVATYTTFADQPFTAAWLMTDHSPQIIRKKIKGNKVQLEWIDSAGKRCALNLLFNSTPKKLAAEVYRDGQPLLKIH